MKKKITERVSSCLICHKNKHSKGYTLDTSTLAKRTPFKFITSDIIGPFNNLDLELKGCPERFYYITFSDRCTYTVHVKATEEIGAEEVIAALQEWIEKYRKPREIRTDQGRQYLSLKLRSWLNSHGIEHKPLPPFCPQGNGISERINGVIKNVLRTNRRRSLEVITQTILNSLNIGRNRVLRFSPSEITQNYSSLDALKRPLQIDLDAIFTKSKKESDRSNARNNKARIRYHYAINELVLLKNHDGRKMIELYLGPFTILAITPDQQQILLDTNDKRC